MAFNIPTLSEVNRTVENGFSQAFYGTSGVLRAMVLKVVAKVVAGAVYLAILLISNIWKNSFVSTASVDGLVRLGEERGMPPKPASRARGRVTVSGSAGTTIPAGTVVVEANSGNEYEFLAAATIPSGGADVTAQIYSLGYGDNYNLPAETSLTFRDAAPGTFEIEVDSEGLYGGVSVDVTVDGVVRQWGESVDDYRLRLKIRVQNQPMGGSETDFWEWAMSFSEVSDCFVVPNWPATNCVAVYCADFRTSGISLNSTILDDIRTYITSKDRRPATSVPVIGTVTPIDVYFTVAIPVVSDYYKNSVISALTSYFRMLGPGDEFDSESIRQQILGYSGVEKCSVNYLSIDGTTRPTGYTLPKNSSGAGSSFTITGNVVNVSSLSSTVTFVNLAV